MRLRTTVGAYAGEIRDYPFSAGQAALKVGSAELVADTPRPEQAVTTVTPASLVTGRPAKWRPIKRK